MKEKPSPVTLKTRGGLHGLGWRVEKEGEIERERERERAREREREREREMDGIPTRIWRQRSATLPASTLRV